MNSPMLEGQYPEDFEIDREGCKNPWEGVVCSYMSSLWMLSTTLAAGQTSISG